jgi:cytochrome c5
MVMGWVATAGCRGSETPPRTPAVTAEVQEREAGSPSETSPDERGRIDPKTGLVRDEGFLLVSTQCTVCHSAQLITQNRGDKDHWRQIIRWMQRTQNLWPIPEPAEEQILAYLERNYGPRPFVRRAPIPPHLMPPEP